MTEKIPFTLDDGTVIEFYVLEQTKLSGETYLLVTDAEEGDGDALILRQLPGADNKENSYEVVSDDTLLEALAPVFENLLDDVSILQ